MALKLRLLPIERVAAAYCVLTTLLVAALAQRLVAPGPMLLMRAEWLAATALLVAIAHFLTLPPTGNDRGRASSSTPRWGMIGDFIRTAFQLGWLAVWYPDTYEFNRCFDNLDPLFAAADQTLFGCQPSLVFSQLLPGAFWSEAFNLGYWSYFPMIALLTLATFYKAFSDQPSPALPKGRETGLSPIREGRSSFIVHRSSFIVHRSSFIIVPSLIITSFFLFYAIYIFLPVAGPQFYFQAVGTDEILAGHFPALGTYFSSHTEMMPAPGYADGLFYRLVHAAQASGERPTAAFPSSHVGISTIVLILARRHAPRLLPLLLPLCLLLFGATVYIQAHYLVDAIAGLIAAPLILWIATRLHSFIK